MKPVKIAIVGGAPATQMLAPFDDFDWEIWVLGNQLNCYEGKAISRVFEIHDDLTNKPDGYPDWLIKCAPRLTVGELFPIKDHEKVEIYPRAEVEALMGGHLSSSIAYMMGYAMLKPVEEIAIYGVDMAVDDHEFFKQRPDMYAWIGYAMGKGIKVHIPSQTSLFTSNYDEGKHWGSEGTKRGTPPFIDSQFQELVKAHKNKMVEIEQTIDGLRFQLARHKGIAEAYTQMGRVARAVEGGAKLDKLTDVTWHGD